MRGCLDCAFANWNKTVSGRLHPSGDGRCTWTMPEIQVPKSMYYLASADNRRLVPRPIGGQINRHHPEENCGAFKVEWEGG